MTRKLVTVKTITNISPIPGADVIEVVTVDHGWKVVVKKEDNYQIGDKVLYFEVDSWVPHHIAPFLSKGHEPREYEGVKGERLRTIKLRGTTSQGLVLKIKDIFDIVVVDGIECINTSTINLPSHYENIQNNQLHQ